MNIEEFFDERSGKADYREYCLSLPDVTEATPFEKFFASKASQRAERSRGKYTILGRPVLTVVFYVNSHMFCYFRSTLGRSYLCIGL
ncbi:MAG: hypothetical protein IJ647_11140 [Prevotella sp.]|nr:hypothetical protein [Prevotella sp.]